MTEEEKKQQYAKVLLERSAKAKMVEAVASTEPGREFLKYLHTICGYDKSNIVISRTTNEIDPSATTFNEVRRGVYLQIRPFIPVEVRRDIENPIEEKKS